MGCGVAKGERAKECLSAAKKPSQTETEECPAAASVGFFVAAPARREKSTESVPAFAHSGKL